MSMLNKLEVQLILEPQTLTNFRTLATIMIFYIIAMRIIIIAMKIMSLAMKIIMKVMDNNYFRTKNAQTAVENSLRQLYQL